MSEKLTRKQLLGLVVLGIAVIGLSITATLHVSGVPVGAFAGQVSERIISRYQHITLGDAQTACENRAREAFGERVRVLMVDTRSSRLDKSDDLFKVFMEAELYRTAGREGPARQYFINCFTRTNRSQVTLFQYAGDGETFVTPGEEGRGLFGL